MFYCKFCFTCDRSLRSHACKVFAVDWDLRRDVAYSYRTCYQGLKLPLATMRDEGNLLQLIALVNLYHCPVMWASP